MVQSTAMAVAESWIGLDESGKGDYFGPLVVAGVHVTPALAEQLQGLGAQNGKLIANFTLWQLLSKSGQPLDLTGLARGDEKKKAVQDKHP